MGKLSSYKGSIDVPSGFKPMGDYPLIESHDVLVDESGMRLDEKLDNIATPIFKVVANDISVSHDGGVTYEHLLSVPKSAYEYAKNGGYTGTEAQFSALLSNAVDKSKITLRFNDSENRIYLYIDGEPVGNGVALPSGGASGDVIGNISADNTIILSGNIADGTYTVKYEMEGGKIIDIGTFEKTDTPDVITYTVTNNLVACNTSNNAETVNSNTVYQATITPDADAAPTTNKKYSGITAIRVKMGGVDISSTAVSGSNINIPNVTGNIVISCIGYKTGVRLSLSAGGESEQDGTESTGFIPATKDSVLRIKNIAYSGDTTRGVVGYDANFTKLTIGNGSAIASLFDTYGFDDGNGVRRSNRLGSHRQFDSDDLKYIRLCSTDINANSILTVDQEIV